MNQDLQRDVLERLSEFKFRKEQRGYLRGGTCPSCHKKELYTHADHPWVVRCGRLNHCGWEGHVKELYPDLFEKWSERYPSTPENRNPNAAADAYLKFGRGFDLAKIQGAYTQEQYFDRDLRIGSVTVRFSMANGYWERLIDQPQRFGKKKARFSFGLDYQGLWWQSATLQLLSVKEIWIVEGIFDAIALMHHGIAAVSAMSSSNYPEKALADLAASRGNKDVTLVWALDGDAAGRSFTLKHVQRATEAGWQCKAAQIPQTGKNKIDWNDAHQRDRLQQSHIDAYLYYGSLLIAKTAAEKALLIYNKENRHEFDFEFRRRLYWFSLNIVEYQKVRDAMDKDGTEDDALPEQTKREKALAASMSLRSIANCHPQPLYYQANMITDESWYYFRVDFPHDGAAIKNTFTASQLSSAAEFKKRLLGIAPGALFTGTSQMLDRIIQDKLENIKRVETIDYIGYSIDHGCYVLGDVAVKGGALHDLNSEDYFDIGRLSIKSLNKSVSLRINRDRSEYTTEWLDLLWCAFGAKGLAALTFWFGSLFAEQIRKAHSSYPFLEIVGDAGAGKTTLIELLWKLLGRSGYEGFDPSKSTPAARARNFSQVSNMPVVLIESDRERVDGEKSHIKSFDWDELKTAYNGRSIRARGMATGGNETYEPPFRGAVVIAQNTPVAASEAILSRIVHLYFDRSTQTPASGAAADAIKYLTAEQVSGFVIEAARREKDILQLVIERTPIHQKELRTLPNIKMPRIVETHAQMLALADALAMLVKLPADRHQALCAQIIDMTSERQTVINGDHPIVQEFWEAFDFLNGNPNSCLDHSADPAVIAVNLNHFVQVASEKRQQIPLLRDLKKVLKTSSRRKYIEQKAVNSTIYRNELPVMNGNKPTSTTVKCWVFSNPDYPKGDR
ncbi:MAG TPA: toprim domain-containing protein [Herbaspirillum sp.]|nr:toprim domain-containing protein [Herbaspirillum sp.]